MDNVELVTSHSPLQDAHIKLLRAVVVTPCTSSPIPYMLKLEWQKGIQIAGYKKRVLIPVAKSFS